MRNTFIYYLKRIKYRINKLGQNEELYTKESRLVNNLENIYREFIFREYPKHDIKRIELMLQLMGMDVTHAMYIVNYLHQSIDLDGDICEFGVAQGRTSALLAHEILHTDKKIWLFDSFKGLSKPSKEDKLINDVLSLGSIERYEGIMGCSINKVKTSLRNILFPEERTKIIPGFVEKTLYGTNLPIKVCFAFIDLDLYAPTVAVLYFLGRVLQKNGFIVIHDYDILSTGIKTAVDEFISANKGKYSLILPVEFDKGICIIKKVSDGATL